MLIKNKKKQETYKFKHTKHADKDVLYRISLSSVIYIYGYTQVSYNIIANSF
jgi:hypothetical protein